MKHKNMHKEYTLEELLVAKKPLMRMLCDLMEFKDLEEDSRISNVSYIHKDAEWAFHVGHNFIEIEAHFRQFGQDATTTLDYRVNGKSCSPDRPAIAELINWAYTQIMDMDDGDDDCDGDCEHCPYCEEENDDD